MRGPHSRVHCRMHQLGRQPHATQAVPRSDVLKKRVCTPLHTPFFKTSKAGRAAAIHLHVGMSPRHLCGAAVTSPPQGPRPWGRTLSSGHQ